MQPHVLLLDIEGTTTSISFVKDVLFPYVRTNLPQYLDEKWGSAELRSDIAALRELADAEIRAGDQSLLPIPDESADERTRQAVVHDVTRWMDADKKCTALKQLQGHMWRAAYASGVIKGHLYPDVVPSLRELAAKRRVCIYSSGSVEAQKLLFGYSLEGDITPMIDSYFDTNVGAKTSAESYTQIARVLGVETACILFLTDIPKEAYAAKAAGVRAVLVRRPGNAELDDEARETFDVIDDFSCLRDRYFQA